MIVFASFRFSDTGRAGEECDAPGATAPRRLADSGDGTLDDIEHVGDGVGLTLYPSLHEFLCRTDLVAADLAPGIFRYADLETSDRVRDPVECDILAPRELRDGAQIDKQKSFGFIDEAFD